MLNGIFSFFTRCCRSICYSKGSKRKFVLENFGALQKNLFYQYDRNMTCDSRPKGKIKFKTF